MMRQKRARKENYVQNIVMARTAENCAISSFVIYAFRELLLGQPIGGRDMPESWERWKRVWKIILGHIMC
jgi:hypothetical protein